MGEGIEWTPAGPRPLSEAGRPVLENPQKESPGAVVQQVDAPKQSVLPGFVAYTAQPATHQPIIATGPRLTPKTLLKQARARVRELDAEIKRLRRLEQEREELRRLIAAADGRPLAVVRDIKRPSA